MMTDDYRAATTACAWFAMPDLGVVEVAGPEAPEFLHNLCTNDVKNLPLGGGCEAFFCNVRARALFYVGIDHVLHEGEHALWIVVPGGFHSGLVQHLDRHLIAENAVITDRSMEFMAVHLAGPTAKQVLDPLPDLAEGQHLPREIGGVNIHVRRRDWLGMVGYDLLIASTGADAFMRWLRETGAVEGAPATAETLRIEAGTPLYGKDIDENRFVSEVCRPQAISFTKGCYLGQEPIVMARDRAGHLSRYFRGLRMESMAAVGAALFSDKGDVGAITSVADSPRLGAIGLGYVRRGNEGAGTTLRVGAADGPTATVVDVPII